jgi:CarboxypepD_reg-like domain
MRFLTTVALLFLGLTSIMGQGQLKGIITDAKGKPIVGAKISETGSNFVTYTRLDGTYSLNYSKNSSVYVISSEGFAPKEFRVAERRSDNITLRSSAGANLQAFEATRNQGGFFKKLFRKSSDN